MVGSVNIHRLLILTGIYKDGGEDNIVEFAVWAVVMRFLDSEVKLSNEQRRENVRDVLEKEIDKWIK